MSQPDVVVVLNNIRSLYNVGSIFRTSDALGIKKLYLCGITGTPEHYRLAKTALKALSAVNWEYKQSAYRTIRQLKKDGYYLVSLEITSSSQPLKKIGRRPLALVLGHELSGIENRILQESDEVIHIPMKGVGTSMNVAVAYGIAAYMLR
jgi:tRNA G18 (ribose-2'-O)-methylase SpoU